MNSKDVVVGDARIASGQNRRRLTAPVLVGAVAMCVALFGGASSAFAGAGLGIVPSVPQDVAVGQTGVASQLAITNIAVDNPPGESGYESDSYRLNLITLVPSCGSQLAGADCPPGFLDAGVIVPNPLTATGRDNTACAGRTFVISLSDVTQGKYTFTPDAPIVLGPSSGLQSGYRCIINFTVDIMRVPQLDSDAPDPGPQTDQKAFAGGLDIGPTNSGQPATGTGSAQTTVRSAPTITTVASQNITLGAGNLSDQATVSGLVSPVTGAGAGTVVFRLYGPGDTTCANPIYTSPSQALTLNGAVGTAQSPTYAPTAAGTYQWQAFYSGDINNAPVNGACNEATETRTVSAPPVAPPGAGVLSEVCTTPPGPAPAGGKLCARGTAAIAGRTGCQGTPFAVTVKGRQIQRVVFTLDGKVVRRLTKANRGSTWVLRVNPRALRRGVHRVIAKATFRPQSGTKARTMRVTFTRCSRRAAAPAFTG